MSEVQPCAILPVAAATGQYSPSWVSAYYDEYGTKEWDRLTKAPVDKVSFVLHRHYLQQFVKPGARVLEIGSGPGRFTQVLAEIGSRVVVSDISEGQLDLHRKYAKELNFEHAVESRQCLDVCDLSVLASDSFDTVVAYGGPLSYVFDQAGLAMRECLRVCKPGGHVLSSVMSLWGACHRHLEGILVISPESNRKITDTGDLSPENWDAVKHRCHMFRSGEFRDLATASGLRVVAISASNYLSINQDQYLSGIAPDSKEWQELIRMELEACRQDGCLDAGTHIILVGQKPKHAVTTP